MQPTFCIFLNELKADLVVFGGAKQVSNWNSTTIPANKKANYSKLINHEITDTTMYFIK